MMPESALYLKADNAKARQQARCRVIVCPFDRIGNACT